MLTRDPALSGIAHEARGIVRQVGEDIAGAPDERLSGPDLELVENAIEGLRPLLGEIHGPVRSQDHCSRVPSCLAPVAQTWLINRVLERVIAQVERLPVGSRDQDHV